MRTGSIGRVESRNFCSKAGLSALALLLAGPTAFAEENFTFRALINMGIGSNSFSQSDGTHSTEVDGLNSLGTGFQFGFGISRFFVEYNAFWLMAPYTAQDRSQDAGYLTLKGLNAGVALAPIPVEVYAGVEGGSYTLHGGGGVDYGGLTWKLGVNGYLVGGNPGSFKIGGKVEYRHMNIGSDDSGSIPGGITTQAKVIWAGLTIGAG